MFTGFSGDSAQPSSQQQQQLENNGIQQQTAAAASSTNAPGAAAVTTTPATSLGQGTPGQVYSTPTLPVGVALGVASAGGLLPSPAYGWLCIAH